MLGFHFLTAMGCGNKCQRAGGDAQRPSPITENYLLLPKVVFEPSGLHLRCDWIMAVWHTPLMELSHRLCSGACAVASQNLLHSQAVACAALGQDGRGSSWPLWWLCGTSCSGARKTYSSHLKCGPRSMQLGVMSVQTGPRISSFLKLPRGEKLTTKKAHPQSLRSFQIRIVHSLKIGIQNS